MSNYIYGNGYTSAAYIDPRKPRFVVNPEDAKTAKFLREAADAIDKGHFTLLERPKLDWIEFNMEKEVQINLSMTLRPR